MELWFKHFMVSISTMSWSPEHALNRITKLFEAESYFLGTD